MRSVAKRVVERVGFIVSRRVSPWKWRPRLPSTTMGSSLDTVVFAIDQHVYREVAEGRRR